MIIVPSFVLLIGLVLRGRFDEGAPAAHEAPQRRASRTSRSLAAVAVALLVAGVALVVVGEGAALAIGVFAIVGFIALGALELLAPGMLGGD